MTKLAKVRFTPHVDEAVSEAGGASPMGEDRVVLERKPTMADLNESAVGFAQAFQDVITRAVAPIEERIIKMEGCLEKQIAGIRTDMGTMEGHLEQRIDTVEQRIDTTNTNLQKQLAEHRAQVADQIANNQKETVTKVKDAIRNGTIAVGG